jgi:hypothetical protein
VKDLDWKLKVALALGAFLSWPVYRGWSAGTIGTNSAMVRVGIAVAFAYAGVYVVTAVVKSYLPEPQPEPEEATPELDGVEDAVLVEQTGAMADDADAPAES